MSKTKPRDDSKQESNKKRLILKTIIYDESKANQWLDDPPLEIWDHHIIPLLGLRDLALARPVCTFFETYWQEKIRNNVLPLRVPRDVATIDRAMRVIEIISSRWEYTKLNPSVVLLGKGEHQITSSWTEPSNGRTYVTKLGITRNNISFVGTGKESTTILGGFEIRNQENVSFKQMTVTNTSQYGSGIRMTNAKVELFDVSLKGCETVALWITESTSATTLVATRCEFANSSYGAAVYGSLTSATFKNCVFHDNFNDGVFVNESTIHLHGEATAVHSNGGHGIFAYSSGSKVLIHLPSHHNTSYNNGGQDRYTSSGGTITNVED